MPSPALASQSEPDVFLLLVEDDASDAFLIEDLLGARDFAGYGIHHVKTCTEALSALARRRYDVCLLDLTLPDVAGFSALVDIQEKAPDMPVLILTGVDDISLAKRAVSRGAQDYLLKGELEIAMLTRSIEYARERKHVEKELFRRANYDALTGLANRSLFETRLKMALARNERNDAGLAVLFMDLDGFKSINDNSGHDAGDRMLKAVAERMKSVLRPYDTAARFGGDEFAVLLENISQPRDAATIAQKIISVLGQPVDYHGKKLSGSASIGIAFCDSTAHAELLIQHADAAMYEAKSDGGGTYRFYAADIHEKAKLLLKAERELRLALLSGQLALHYQPYVTPDDNSVIGVEVLLRWAHPERALLSADEFIALAEECRLMPDIGKWMLTQLECDMRSWDIDLPAPLEIAFNLSASQLDDRHLARCIASLLAKSDLRKYQFVAEVDAGALGELSESRFLTFVALREMGITLHLDHFGQRPVSLQTLHTYPFSLLKLNLSSIEKLDRGGQADAMIHTAIDLAHQLGMKAGAVGVETSGHMQMLRSRNCDRVQGYLIGRPMTHEQLPGWLAEMSEVKALSA